MRLPNWEKRLAEFIQSHENARFEWGSFDCLQFCIGGELAITGKSRLAELNAGIPYGSLRESIRGLSKLDCADVFDLADKVKERKPLTLLKRGDWVGVPAIYGNALSIFDGIRLVGVNNHGLVRQPISTGIYAWRLD
jgi:hypothetical protein